jgi:tRNA A37 threonylcarbamoyladenosine dehydratase
MEETNTTECCSADEAGAEKECQTSGTASPELDLPRERRRIKPWEATDLQHRSNSGQTRPVIDRIPRRWDRLVRLIGEDATKKLLSSRVTVFGLGGVGSYAVESLARSAIGQMTIVDFDDVCVTNVNRQMQAFPSTVGQSKAELLANRVRAINPDADVEAVQAFYDPETSEALLSPEPDFVIDAIDNVTAKLHLLSTCLKKGIPVVSVAGASAKMDPTMIQVADLSKTRIDPLARVVRKELSRRGIDTTKHVGLPVVFSEEKAIDPESPTWDAEGFRCICPHAEDSPHECEKRRLIYGTASFVTATFGHVASSVVVRELSK